MGQTHAEENGGKRQSEAKNKKKKKKKKKKTMRGSDGLIMYFSEKAETFLQPEFLVGIEPDTQWADASGTNTEEGP